MISSRKDLNRNFKISIGASLTFSGLLVLTFFVAVVVNKSIFNPQYTIPLAGMIIGNAMTGVNIAIKTFMDDISKEKIMIPTTAIMYQIAIMITICTSVCIIVFLSLNLGYKSLYNDKKQFIA